MKHSYRITKYKINQDGKLCSLPNEWTSYSDIGNKVSRDEYIKVENIYLNCALDIYEYLNVASLKIKELEVYDDSVLYLEDQVIKKEQLIEIIKSILREKCWCKLISENCEFHFGYDYYMYIISTIDIFDFLKSKYSSLSIQRFSSPYL